MGRCISKQDQSIEARKIKTNTHESILKSKGLLPVSSKWINWFPTGHAHNNVRTLFKWGNRIGEGKTSMIHKIQYKGKTCVVKQIKKDKSGKVLFIKEARILSKLYNNGIIGLIDMFFDECYYYLLIEKADYDLYSMISNKGYLSEKRIKIIIYKLLKTVEYLHKNNIVHRDLKPNNIVFKANKPNQPILIDFGDAAIIKKYKIYNEFVGTLAYMSPQRLNNNYSSNELTKSDIWAIGTIAYEMYTGNVCFDGNTSQDIFNNITNGKWSWPATRIPSNDLKDFIDKCLNYNPNDRPSATQALKHDWFNGTGLQTTPAIDYWQSYYFLKFTKL